MQPARGLTLTRKNENVTNSDLKKIYNIRYSSHFIDSFVIQMRSQHKKRRYCSFISSRSLRLCAPQKSLLLRAYSDVMTSIQSTLIRRLPRQTTTSLKVHCAARTAAESDLGAVPSPHARPLHFLYDDARLVVILRAEAARLRAMRRSQRCPLCAATKGLELRAIRQLTLSHCLVFVLADSRRRSRCRSLWSFLPRRYHLLPGWGVLRPRSTDLLVCHIEDDVILLEEGLT